MRIVNSSTRPNYYPPEPRSPHARSAYLLSLVTVTTSPEASTTLMESTFSAAEPYNLLKSQLKPPPRAKPLTLTVGQSPPMTVYPVFA